MRDSSFDEQEKEVAIEELCSGHGAEAGQIGTGSGSGARFEDPPDGGFWAWAAS